MRALAGLLFALVLSGCASPWPQTAQLGADWPQDLPERVELAEVPFFPQLEYQCGPAALATVLAGAGVVVTPDQLVAQVYLPARKGSLQIEMVAAARRRGLVAYELAPRFEDLLREIAAGTPVIVLQNLGFVDGWHYAVAVGYDYGRAEIVLRSGETRRKVMPFGVHEAVWKRSGYWAMVALPPGGMPATAEEPRWLAAIAAFERTGDAKGARAAYARFLERWPDNITAAVGLANAHHALGELAEAERVLRTAAEREPGSVVVLNNLAQTLADLGRHEEALPVIERAAAAGGPFAAAVAQTRQGIRDAIAAKRR